VIWVEGGHIEGKIISLLKPEAELDFGNQVHLKTGEKGDDSLTLIHASLAVWIWHSSRFACRDSTDGWNLSPYIVSLWELGFVATHLSRRPTLCLSIWQ
jgi:hypothetical protein